MTVTIKFPKRARIDLIWDTSYPYWISLYASYIGMMCNKPEKFERWCGRISGRGTEGKLGRQNLIRVAVWYHLKDRGEI